MKKLIYLFALAVAAFATACSDDDTPNGNNSGNQGDADSLAKVQQFLDSASADAVVRNLYNIVDTTSASDSTYVPKYGVRLKETAGNTYYIACKNAVDALNFFKFNCSNETEEIIMGDTATTDLKDRECTFGQWGKTTLSFGEGNPVVATITVDMTAVGELHTFCFVPQAYIDDNNSQKPYYNSAYEIGDIVQDANFTQWLCVKAASPGSAGLLVCMKDDGYRISQISDEVKTVSYRVGNYAALASREAWLSLIYGVSYMQYDDAYDVIINKKHGVNMDGLIPILKNLLNESQPGWSTVQQVGNVYGIQKKGHWWLWMSVWNSGWYPLYEIQLPFVRFENGKSPYVGVSFSCKEFNTCGNRIGNSTLKTGPQLFQQEFWADELPGSKRLWPTDYH